MQRASPSLSFLAACAVLASLVSHARAADPPPQGDEPEVVVAGEPMDQSASSTILTQRDLVLEASGRLENAVTDVPGVGQFRRSDARSAHPTSQGLTLRGLGGNAASRVLVLQDGVPQSDPFGGWIAWPSYDVLPLAEARLERGGGSGVYGPGALGGTLELVTAEPRSLGLGGAVLGGSRDTVSWRLSAGLPAARVTSVLGVRHETSAGFVPTAEGQRGPVDGPAPYSQLAGALRSRFMLPKEVELTLTGRAFADSRTRGLPFTENYNDGLDLSVRVSRTGLRGTSWSLLAYVQDRELRSSFASVAEDRTSATQVLDQYHVPSTGLGARLEVAPDLGQDARVRLGADWRTVLGQTNERYFFVEGAPTRERQAGGQNDSVGAFVAFDGRVARGLTLSASARADVVRLGGGFRRETELSGNLVSSSTFEARGMALPTARLGLGYEIGRGLLLRSATFVGFRAPTLNELYRPYRVGADATAANEELASERIFGTELGFELHHPRGIGLSLTAFTNHLLGAISNVTVAEGPGDFPGVGFVPVGGTYARRENVDSLRSVGLEALLELDGEALLGLPIRAELSYAHVHATVSDDRVPTAARPPQVPENMLTARFTAAPLRGRVRFAATVRTVGEQFEDDRNRTALAGATTLDLGLVARIVASLSLLFRAENVTNEPVQVARDARGTLELGLPRTLWLGVTFGDPFALRAPNQ